MTAFVTAAFRTPVMPRGGAFAGLSLQELAAPLVTACLTEAGVAPDEVADLILSNALGAGGNPARVVALAAGLPQRVAGLTIDRQCAGGLDALLLAQALIEAGQAEAVLAGGVESYSRRPIRLRTDPGGGPAVPYDQPPFTPWPDRDPDMAEAAARLARSLGIGRDRQDAWALRSHAAALAAAGRMQGEIVPLLGINSDGFTRHLTVAVAARAPVISGTITAANAAVAADGAALCLVLSDRLARRSKRALRILGGVTLGGRPEEPGLAPVAAIVRVLDRAGIRAADLSLAEVMEAYAVQAIACVEGAGLDPDLVNGGGGALARGHPIGASGAILAVRLFHDLRAGTGLAAIAAAGGLGTALLLGA
ncbi:MAG: thiolase family protein [Rhodobacter sp.]|nr:thiolase family protein [Rhodobacter sp.]